jgi:hypothetical protein
MFEMRALRDATIRANWSLNWTAGGPLLSSIDIGDAEDFRSLLLWFRRFVASDADAHFFSIANLVERELAHPFARERFREYRTAWASAMAGRLSLVIDEVQLKASAAFDLLTNAYLFHDDVDKEARFEGLPLPVQDLIETNVANLVIDCVGILAPARNALKVALDGTL